MIRLLLVLVAVGPAICQAEPYWVRYDGASGLYPEQSGWLREASDPAPARWLEDGALSIDSRSVPLGQDEYAMYFDGTVDPAPSELFVMRWQLKVDEIEGMADPGVLISSDDHYVTDISFACDRLWAFPFTGFAFFAPGAFHTYELRSTDMRSFELLIDGEPGIQGQFTQDLFPTRVKWGDLSTDSSLAQWRYVEFGVVPEPSGLFILLVGTWLSARCGSKLLVCRKRRAS